MIKPLYACAAAAAVLLLLPAAGAPPPLVVDEADPLLLDAADSEAESAGDKKKTADNQPCFVCHVNYESEPLALWHAAEGVGCVDCHGDSFAHRNDENNTTPPDTMYPAGEIDDACGECHDTHDVPAAEVVARWLERRSDSRGLEAAVCTDCHGQHRLKVRTVRWDKKTKELLSGSRPAAGFTWQRTDRTLALLNHGKVVWRHVHDRTSGKPYLRFGLPDGTELTRPVPIPEGYPKADHVWHRALWWSWKYIDGINFWEQHQTGTDPVAVECRTGEDGSARIALTIAYHVPDAAPLAEEERVIEVTAPSEDGSYLISWRAVFRPAGDAAVVFDKNSYGGLAIRFAAECCGPDGGGTAPWVFVDSEGRSDSNNLTARWVAYHGTAPNGAPACVAVFDHPDNPRHPVWWQTRSHYPYLNPSLTCREDYRLDAGEELILKYGILVQSKPADPVKLEQAWKRFAGQRVSAGG